MTKNKMRVALAVMVTLLITGCGLKGDLYIPAETPEVAPTDAQTPDESGSEKEPDRSAEPAP